MLAEIAGWVNDGRTHNYPEGSEIIIQFFLVGSQEWFFKSAIIKPAERSMGPAFPLHRYPF